MTAAILPSLAAISREGNAVDHEALDTWTLLQQSYLLTHKAIDQALAKAGISYAQASVLLALTRASGPLPLSRLARVLVQEAQSVTSLVDRLERRGLVQRIPDQHDRRVIKVALSEAGERLLAVILPVAMQAAGAAFSDFEAADLAALRGHLGQVRARSAATLAIDVATFAAADDNDRTATESGSREGNAASP